PPGRYYLSVSERRLPAGVNNTSRVAAEANVTTFYPNGADSASAAPIDIAAGAELRGFDIRMRRDKVFWIRGKVVDASGAVAPNKMIRFTPKEQPAGLEALLGADMVALMSPRADGAFEYRNLVPGTYVLQGASGTVNGVPSTAIGRMEITVTDSNIDNLVF